MNKDIINKIDNVYQTLCCVNSEDDSYLKNAMNACCGHGKDNEAYIQLLDNSCIRGKKAITIIRSRI